MQHSVQRYKGGYSTATKEEEAIEEDCEISSSGSYNNQQPRIPSLVLKDLQRCAIPRDQEWTQVSCCIKYRQEVQLLQPLYLIDFP